MFGKVLGKDTPPDAPCTRTVWPALADTRVNSALHPATRILLHVYVSYYTCAFLERKITTRVPFWRQNSLHSYLLVIERQQSALAVTRVHSA